MSKYVIVGVMAVMLAFSGCQDEGSDDRLIEVAVKQDKHKGDIDKLSKRVEGFENRLVGIEQSLEKLPPPTGTPEAAVTAEEETTGPKVVEFKDTPEYSQIAAQLSAIQQRLGATQSGLVETQEGIAREQEQRRLRDPAEAMRAMSNPQEMNRRLTLLAQNFAGKIEDPVKRQQFEVDVQQLKRNLSENQNLSAQERYQQVTSDLAERLKNEENERAREFIQRQVQSLETASAEELEGRLERYSRFGSMRLLRDLQSKYDIPRETYRDAGLPSMGMGRGGPMGMGRGGPRGRRGR